MSKNYSKHTNLEKGYITGCKIEDGEVIIETNGTGKNKAFRYKLQVYNLEKINGRIKLQHDTVYSSKKLIAKEGLLKAGIATLIAILFNSASYLIEELPMIIDSIFYGISIVSALSTVVLTTSTVIEQKNLETKNKAFTFVREIDAAMSTDQNITRSLSEAGREVLKTNNLMKTAGNLENVFNPIAINELSQKDLDNIVLAYEIYRDLNTEITPAVTAPKTRKLTKQPEKQKYIDKQ